MALDNESTLNSVDDENKIIRMVSNLLDINLIKNMWCLNKEANNKIVQSLYKNLATGYYLGACLTAGKDGKEAQYPLLEKYMNKIYGCPVLRM